MKIGALSRETGLSIHTLRYYEKLGLINKTHKDSSGHRTYRAQDIELVNWVNCLKQSGMPLEKIKTYVQAFTTQDHQQMAEILCLHLEQLEKQQLALAHYFEVTQYKLAQLKSLT